MKSIRKFIALFLSVLLIMAVSPMALAEDEASGEATEEATDVAEWYTNFGVKGGSGTFAEAAAGVTKNGSIKLVADAVIDETVTISTTCSIVGNSFSIKRDAAYTGVLIDVADGAAVTLSAVTVDGNSDETTSSTDSLITITNGSLTLSDSSVLTNNVGRYTTGAAVYAGVDSETIEAEDATASLVINAGSAISDCTAYTGGAIALGNNASLTMTGGTITNCIAATNGGAIALLAETASANLSGVEITGCTASAQTAGYGSAVYAESGTVTITGSTISGNTNTGDLGALAVMAAANATVGGDIYIYDNMGSSAQSNVYLQDGTVLTISPDFTEGSKIGITTESGFTGGTVDFIESSCDITGYVFDDATDTAYYVSDDIVTLLEYITVTFDPGNGTCSETSRVYAVDVDFGYLPTPDDRDGFDFLGWYTSGGTLITEDTAVTYYEDMTLYAQWDNLNALDDSPLAVIGRFFERIGDLMRMVFDFLINLFMGGGDQDLNEL
ncbi:MAG: InlB B-repeat-containing protein [Clostridiales bacterium]|nr:InlB B-repeat-containing protein [Clostridiales bacterium]